MLKVRDVVRASLTRFFPGAVILLTAVLAFDAARGVPFLGARVQLHAADIAGLVVGYAVGLVLLRTRLRADAQVQGRRSVIAGIVAAAASYWLFMVLGNPWHDWTLYVSSVIVTGLASGVGGTLAVFFPWLTTASKSAPAAAAAHASPNGELR